MQLKVPIELENSVQLLASEFRLKMSGKILTQFQMTNFTAEVDASKLKYFFKINLQRMFLYHLTNTYLPTLTLLILVEMTLFFDESHLQFSIGLCLTIMLVMYTMFQVIYFTSFSICLIYWVDNIKLQLRSKQNCQQESVSSGANKKYPFKKTLLQLVMCFASRTVNRTVSSVLILCSIHCSSHKI